MTHQATFKEARHAHHWVIESPDGRNISPGVCKVCGAPGEFRNWFEEDPKVWSRTKGKQR